MNASVVVILLGILTNSAKSMIHSLKYFDTRSPQIPNLPEFVAVVLLNDLQIIHFDSETKRVVPKQDWMNKIKEEDPQIWDEETRMYLNLMRMSKSDTEMINKHLNLNRDEHILQRMGGCEWDDETNNISGYCQLGFDGEDFISFDLKTATWVALNPQAVFLLDNWNRGAAYVENLINHVCPELLKKYVRYEERTLKKELPLLSLLQKTSLSPVTCHVTGFYPRDRAMLFWTKDGEELHENVDPGEILPNNDGTFQMSVDLDVCSLPSEEWERYECVLKVSRDKDRVIRLDRAEICTIEKNSHIIAAVLVVLGVAIFAVVGVVLYRRFRNNNAK